MDVLIGGQSSIDLQELRVESWDEATLFMSSYGYDPEDTGTRRLIHAVLVEALSFLETQLLTPREWSRGIRPPDEVLQCQDVRHLLLWASGKSPEDRLKRAWACSLLRVMHTIAHIEGVVRHANMNAARDQVMSRFHGYIKRDADGSMWLGEGDDRVKLERVDWKTQKSRNSIILKLLHKRDNVADTIYDYLGVRMVTARLCDVMLVVKYLRQFYLISYPNCYPARARNNLLDTQRFRTQVETLRDMLTAGSISPDEFENMIARVTASNDEKNDKKEHGNPHSASTYRSIQMTARQLIDPADREYEWLTKIKAAVEAGGLMPSTATALAEVANLVEGWATVKAERQGDRQLGAFFPFEIQIMDVESYVESQAGMANHNRYKQSQIRAARKRVLGKVLELSRQNFS